jgi:hypothetical protein
LILGFFHLNHHHLHAAGGDLVLQTEQHVPKLEQHNVNDTPPCRANQQPYTACYP